MENQQRQASEVQCILCSSQAVAFWPAMDPDIPSNPYCRQCLDETKIKLLEVLSADKKTAEKSKRKQELLQRVITVNLIIEKIASLGRHFFEYKGKVARISVDDWGKIWYECEYIGSTNRTRFCLSSVRPLQTHEWYHGGTLASLIMDFKGYIFNGGHQNGKNGYGGLYCTHWGYNEDDMKEIQKYARELGYLQTL